MDAYAGHELPHEVPHPMLVVGAVGVLVGLAMGWLACAPRTELREPLVSAC